MPIGRSQITQQIDGKLRGARGEKGRLKRGEDGKVKAARGEKKKLVSKKSKVFKV